MIRKFAVDKHAHKPSPASPHRRHAWYVGVWVTRYCTVDCTLYSTLQCKLYSTAQCKRYSTLQLTVQYISVYTVLCTLYIVHCAIHYSFLGCNLIQSGRVGGAADTR